jgi:hypothetical protein
VQTPYLADVFTITHKSIPCLFGDAQPSFRQRGARAGEGTVAARQVARHSSGGLIVSSRQSSDDLSSRSLLTSLAGPGSDEDPRMHLKRFKGVHHTVAGSEVDRPALHGAEGDAGVLRPDGGRVARSASAVASFIFRRSRYQWCSVPARDHKI